MQPVTMEDRRKELRSLLQQMEEHPERDWSEQTVRVNVLREMLARHEAGLQAAQEAGLHA